MLSGQVGVADGSGPQFEPVSPDDDERAPSTSEGNAHLRYNRTCYLYTCMYIGNTTMLLYSGKLNAFSCN